MYLNYSKPRLDFTDSNNLFLKLILKSASLILINKPEFFLYIINQIFLVKLTKKH